jgi:hypothetical protein
MVERATEIIKVNCVDGKEREVKIYKFIGFRREQQILQNLMTGEKMRKGESVDLDAGKGMKIITDLAEEIWAKDNPVSLDEVEASSLYKIISGKFDTFLGKHGLSVEDRDNPGDTKQPDK